jgi:hypothetical protein
MPGITFLFIGLALIITGILPIKRKRLGPEEGLRGNIIKGDPAIVFGGLSIMLGMIVIFVSITGIIMRHHIIALYKGDGKLSISELPTLRDKYLVDLGPIDLCKEGSYMYRVGMLPQEEFTLGITTNGIPSDVNVYFKFENHDGVTLFENQSNLGEWNLAHDISPKYRYYYLKGQQGKSTIDKGGGVTVTYYQRGFVGIDASWGTTFTPKEHSMYTLRVKIAPRKTKTSQLSGRLKFRSGIID